MEDKNAMSFEEVMETEITDIWDIFFPYITDSKDNVKKTFRHNPAEQTKPRRYLRFLTM